LQVLTQQTNIKEEPHKKVAKESIEGKDLDWLNSQSFETKLELLKHHLEISRTLVNGVMSEEVCAMCGDRHSGKKPHDGRYSRWGYNGRQCQARRPVASHVIFVCNALELRKMILYI